MLVVDDDAEIRDFLRRSLEGGGWTVLEAEHGEAALERLVERPADVILLDLMMPVMDGFELMARLLANEAWRRIPVIVVSAKDLTAEERKMLSRRVEKILPKTPHLGEQLIAHLREITGLPRSPMDDETRGVE